jgi:hypothetical protein
MSVSNMALISIARRFSHQEEVAPLFGTGALSLLDDSDEENPGQTSTIKQATGSNYGTINSEDDETASPSAATGTTAGSATSSKKGNKIVILESGKPERPPRNCFLVVFHFIEAFGVVTSLCLMATQAMPIVLIPLSDIGAMSLVLKIYISLFCFLFVLLEWDAPIPFLRDATFLQKFFSRGESTTKPTYRYGCSAYWAFSRSSASIPDF